MLGEGTEGSRRKALWAVMLNMKHDEKLDVSLEELNKTFHPPLDDMQLQKILTILLKPLTKINTIRSIFKWMANLVFTNLWC